MKDVRIILAFTLLIFVHQGLAAQCGPVISSFPYNENFEASAAWTTGGTNNDWAWGTPAHPTINSAGGGTKSWCLGGLTGSQYNNSEQSWLMGPCFDFTSLNYPWISFKIFWECERQFEGMQLQSSLDGGTTWTRVGNFGDPVNCLNQNWYNIGNVTYLTQAPAGSRQAWSGRIGATSGGCSGSFGSAGWVTASHCISGLAGQPSVRFRFIFGAGTTCNNFDGIAIDDILIQNAQPNNANFSTTCAGGLTVNFTNLSAMCPTGYAWNFGDPSSGASNTSIATNPSHTFSAAGIYNVSLTASGPCNAPSTIIIPVTVTSTSVNFTNVTCHGAVNGTATANTTGSAGPFTYSWSTTPVQNTQTATNLSPGTYTVTVTSTGVCSSTQTVTISQPPVLNLAVTAYNDANCGMNNGSITVTPSGGNGGNNFTWSPSVSTSSVASSLTPGSYTCMVTDAQGCTSSTSALINNIPPFPPSVGNTGPFCEGSTIQLNSSGGIGYSWTGPAGFTSAVQNPSLPSATPAMAGTYTVVVTSSPGCTSSNTTTVVINSLPVSTAVNTGPYCPNSTIQLNANGGINYNWNGPLGFSGTGSSVSITSATVGMSGVYTVEVTDTNGCTSSTTTSVTVNANPNANASNTGPYCTGATIQLNSNGGTSYTWLGPLSFSSGSQNPTIGSSTNMMTGDYTVTVTDTNGCSGTATTSVIVNNNIAVVAGSNSPVCEGSQLDLNTPAIPGVNFDWTGPNSFSAPGQQNPSIPSVTIAASGIYTVTATDGSGCTGTATVTTMVHPNPIPVANNNGPICEGSNLNFSSNGGNVFDWTGPNSFNQPNTQNPVISPVTSLNSGNYTVVVTDVNGCTASTTTSVIVNPNPMINAGNNGPICEGSDLNLSANGGINYAWAGPNSFIDLSSQNPVITNAPVQNNGTYTVLVTDANGCTSTATTTAVINAAPLVLANTNAPLCTNSDINLNANGAFNYVWIGPNGFSSSSQSPVIMNASTIDNGTYTVTGTDANNCTNTATIVVNVFPSPIAAFSGNPLEGCAPLCVDLLDQSVANGSFISTWNWNVESQPGSGFSSPMFCFNDPGQYDVSLTVTSGDGCIATLSIPDYIHVNTSPVANFSFPSSVVYGDDAEVNFTNQSVGATAYSWLFGDGGNSTIFEPVYSYSDTGTYCIELQVTDPEGCKDTATHCLQVIPEYSLYIPNSFTPNGDEINEIFMVYGRGIATIQAHIFDRWGEEIFTFSDINEGWPGTTQKGIECQIGAYTYHVEVTNHAGEIFEFRGLVNLLR